jgi:hypothetical protein
MGIPIRASNILVTHHLFDILHITTRSHDIAGQRMPEVMKMIREHKDNIFITVYAITYM